MKNNLEEVSASELLEEVFTGDMERSSAVLLSKGIKKVEQLEQELQRLKSNFAGYENFQREKQLEQELQKTREQLSESNELLCFICRKLDEAVFDRQDKITIVTRSLLHKELIEYVSKYNAK